MEKKSISVREMREMLGIGKTDSYWLLKKNCFDTITVFSKTRILVDSFEQWYDSQFWYKKVDGTPPGTLYVSETLSIEDAARLLGITKASVYDILKQHEISYCQIGRNRRVFRRSLMDWCQQTKRYRHISELQKKGTDYEEMLLCERGDADSVNPATDCI